MAFFARPQSRSAAVKIVAPPSADAPFDETSAGIPKVGGSAKKDSTQRRCRNILLYGYCKYEGKGCVFEHSKEDDQRKDISADELPDNANGNGNVTVLPAQAVNAPVFVPRAGVASPPPLSVGSDTYETYGYSESGLENSVPTMVDELSSQIDQMSFGEYGVHPDDPMLMHPDYNGVSAMNPYLQPHDTFMRQPLNYHLYTLPVPTSEGKKFFISDNTREELLKRAETIHTGPAPGLSLPEEVKGYHSLVPLEPAAPEKKKFASWNAMNYRAIKVEDGRAYALRRVMDYRLLNEQAFSVLEKWSTVRHPSIVPVREAFTCRTFGDNSLVVVYDYFADAQTIAETYFKPKMNYHGARVPQERISEASLWSYIFQIASAIKTAHDAGLAVRTVEASKILITAQNRVRISACAIYDILFYDARQDLVLMQQEDMVMFARLILSLCCNNPSAINNVGKSLDLIAKLFSNDIRNVIHYLMKPPSPLKNIQGLFEAFGSKLVLEMDAAHATADRLEGELMGELENSRLVRLLCKFGFINERPEFDRDPRWSETGDRYIVKLFRDYVFHSVDENGGPVVNLAHVLVHLNKLDAGSEERLMLVSRDEQSCLVVTYREIRNCVEAAFGDLSRGSR